MTQKYHHTVPLQDCAQASTIGSIQQILEQLSSFQIEERKERREAEKRIISALERVADQGARISNLEYTSKDMKQSVENFYAKQRELETDIKRRDLRVTSLYTFYKFTTNRYAVFALATLVSLVLIGTINDIIYHTKLFAAISAKILDILK